MRSFSFNGIKKDYIIPLKGSNRPFSAVVSRTYQDVPGRAGAHLVKRRNTGMRTLNIPVMIRGESIAGLQGLKEDVAAWLIHDEVKPLIFDDEPERIYYAVVDGSFDPEELIRDMTCTIPFVCPDGFKHGPEETHIIIGGPIVYSGTAPASPVIEVTFTQDAQNCVITHVETGKEMHFIYGFAAGNKLVIDLARRKYTVNQVLRMDIYDWRNHPFELSPGNNTITIDKPANMTVKYQTRFL